MPTQKTHASSLNITPSQFYFERAARHERLHRTILVHIRRVYRALTSMEQSVRSTQTGPFRVSRGWLAVSVPCYRRLPWHDFQSSDGAENDRVGTVSSIY